MTEDDITQHLIDTLGGCHFEVADDNTFFFHGADNKFPFATIVTKDSAFDSASNLNRPGVFRLNVGVGKETFRALFGDAEPSGIDHTALDRLIPHPVYARMYWVSVINPSVATFETVKPLLAEARNLLVARDKSA
ncbi:hypothetical protein GFK26_28390 [Variovorax paradoxus]|uniref:DUF6194 domain-containing protein n=1 Tax=Variovorax paradoxus TaxID=34073 RepID=A0A5Q0MBZ5_VARPD|nr:DUF6194 family protein [Variovorax paradoxus]QFZ86407.1 hypothetical protein GFK26_28390 [Variovorax paradoxus]